MNNTFSNLENLKEELQKLKSFDQSTILESGNLFKNKPRIPVNCDREVAFNKICCNNVINLTNEPLDDKFEKNLAENNFNRIMRELKFHILEIDLPLGKGKFVKKSILKIDVNPHQRQYGYIISRDIYESNIAATGRCSLKWPYFVQGKTAEIAFASSLSLLYYFFRFPNIIEVNTKKLMTGGDGMFDFMVAGAYLDVKYRNKKIDAGLIVEDSVLNRAPDDLIFISMTNFDLADIDWGLADKPVDEEIEKVCKLHAPLAVTGWITAKEFREKKKVFEGYGTKWLVDPVDLNSVSSLYFKIIENQIKLETDGLIFYDYQK